MKTTNLFSNRFQWKTNENYSKFHPKKISNDQWPRIRIVLITVCLIDQLRNARAEQKKKRATSQNTWTRNQQNTLQIVITFVGVRYPRSAVLSENFHFDSNTIHVRFAVIVRIENVEKHLRQTVTAQSRVPFQCYVYTSHSLRSRFERRIRAKNIVSRHFYVSRRRRNRVIIMYVWVYSLNFAVSAYLTRGDWAIFPRNLIPFCLCS